MIKSTSQTIKGIRFALLASTVASIITLLTLYNGLDSGWFTIRQKQYSFLEKLCEKEGDKKINKLDTSKYKEEFKRNAITWLKNKEKDTTKLCMDIKNEIKSLGEFMTKRRREALYSVNIPWLGLHFDINDLGLISGMFLIIFSLIIAYNLGLKYSNLYKLFNFIDSKCDTDEEKEYYFSLITFSQILKLPDYKSKSISPWLITYIPIILFLLPFIVHVSVFLYDIKTIHAVDTIYPNITFVLIITGLLSFGILNLCVNSIRIDYKTDRLWDEYENKFAPPNTIRK